MIEYSQNIMSHKPILLGTNTLRKFHYGTRTQEARMYQLRNKIRKEYREYIIAKNRNYKVIKNILNL